MYRLGSLHHRGRLKSLPCPNRRGPGLLCPDLLVNVVCFTSFWLLQLEERALGRAILGGDRRLVAGAHAGRRLPVVDELSARGVVAQRRATGGRKLLDSILGGTRGAADLRVLQRLDLRRVGHLGR